MRADSEGKSKSSNVTDTTNGETNTLLSPTCATELPKGTSEDGRRGWVEGYGETECEGKVAAEWRNWGNERHNTKGALHTHRCGWRESATTTNNRRHAISSDY